MRAPPRSSTKMIEAIEKSRRRKKNWVSKKNEAAKKGSTHAYTFCCCSIHRLRCQRGATRGERRESNTTERREKMQTTVTHDKTEVYRRRSVLMGSANKKQQSTVLPTYLVEEGGSHRIRQWTLKSAIVDSLGVTEVVENDKVRKCEKCRQQKIQRFAA
jgi:hypothetical protein